MLMDSVVVYNGFCGYIPRIMWLYTKDSVVTFFLKYAFFQNVHFFQNVLLLQNVRFLQNGFFAKCAVCAKWAFCFAKCAKWING